MLIKFEISRKINVSKEVCLWNTWDHEHLYFVHKQFSFAKMLYENSHVAFIRTKIKLPFLPIYLNCLHSMTRLENGDVMVIDTLPFGILTKLEMKYIEHGPKLTELINLYTLDLPCFFYPFKVFIPKIIKNWNDINWLEDLPLKIRRQHAIDIGFRDFYGKDDSKRGVQPTLRLPMARTKDSILNIE
jgi:hypothetical protein